MEWSWKKFIEVLSFSISLDETVYDVKYRITYVSKKWFYVEFYKLPNNSVFGRSMQNVINMRDDKPVSVFENVYGINY